MAQQKSYTYNVFILWSNTMPAVLQKPLLIPAMCRKSRTWYVFSPTTKIPNIWVWSWYLQFIPEKESIVSTKTKQKKTKFEKAMEAYNKGDVLTVDMEKIKTADEFIAFLKSQ